MSSSASENTLNLAQPEPTLQKNEWYLIAASDEEFQATETSLRRFWRDLPREIETQAREVRDFKQHNDFPLARIKRIMKSDEDVRMIRAEAPILLAKACEVGCVGCRVVVCLCAYGEAKRFLLLFSFVSFSLSPTSLLTHVTTRRSSSSMSSRSDRSASQKRAPALQ